MNEGLLNVIAWDDEQIGEHELVNSVQHIVEFSFLTYV